MTVSSPDNLTASFPGFKQTALKWLCALLGVIVGCGVGVAGALFLFIVTQDPSIRQDITLASALFTYGLLMYGPFLALGAGFLAVFIGRYTLRAWSGAISVSVCVILAAYLGWYGGFFRLITHYPDYPSQSPGGLTTALYTLPGFLNGALTALVMLWFHSRPAYWKSALTFFGSLASTWIICALLLTGRL